ncbi:hypothetical protein GCM10022402_38370 [Salinactinospora qingdaonensis]|uniref:Secreted protein n=1 Tax=Salinactinospora qingdaonensis TaxID=702744 RepID=A0ABP7G4N3_9ACTN
MIPAAATTTVRTISLTTLASVASGVAAGPFLPERIGPPSPHWSPPGTLFWGVGPGLLRPTPAPAPIAPAGPGDSWWGQAPAPRLSCPRGVGGALPPFVSRN